jgi:hypothetical protein
MRPYLKPSSHLIGVFIYIKKGNGTIKNNAKRYPNSYKGRYQLKALQENLSQNGVHIITEMTSNFNSGSAALETYQKGDILGVNCFWGVLSKE